MRISNQRMVKIRIFGQQENINSTENGTPQGGVISPLLANLSLEGIEIGLNEWSGTRRKYKVKARQNKHQLGSRIYSIC